MYNVGDHIVESMKYVRPDRILRLTMLMHDMGKPDSMKIDDAGVTHFKGHAEVGVEIARGIFRRLKFDRETMDRVCNLVRYHDDRYPAKPSVVRRAVHRVGERDYPLLFEIRYADTMAQSTYQREEKLSLIEDTKKVYEQILADKDCLSLSDLAVKGGDLISLGIKPGKEIGDILSNMLRDVLEDPAHNNREYLLDAERLWEFRSRYSGTDQ